MTKRFFVSVLFVRQRVLEARFHNSNSRCSVRRSTFCQHGLNVVVNGCFQRIQQFHVKTAVTRHSRECVWSEIVDMVRIPKTTPLATPHPAVERGIVRNPDKDDSIIHKSLCPPPNRGYEVVAVCRHCCFLWRRRWMMTKARAKRPKMRAYSLGSGTIKDEGALETTTRKPKLVGLLMLPFTKPFAKEVAPKKYSLAAVKVKSPMGWGKVPCPLQETATPLV